MPVFEPVARQKFAPEIYEMFVVQLRSLDGLSLINPKNAITLIRGGIDAFKVF
jgi:hypothetical protein